MSAQTIIPNTFHRVLKEVDDFYICECNKYTRYRDYNVGCDYDPSKFIIIEWMDRIVTKGGCVDISDKEVLEKISLLLKK